MTISREELRSSGSAEQQNRESGMWAAGIDAVRQYDYQDRQWHLHAIVFHHKDKAEAERLRDEWLATALRSQGGKAEPDAWLVGWHSANGDAGTSVYTTEDEARRAAKNMEAYRSSETMTDVLPLYAAPLPSPPENADRERVAKVLAIIFHGDTGEWRGFLSKADAFLAFPWSAFSREERNDA